MQTLSKIQKDFLEYILYYKNDSVSKKLWNGLLSFIKEKYDGLSIEICSNKIKFYSQDENFDLRKVNSLKDDVIQIFVLIDEIYEKKYIISYEKKRIRYMNNGKFILDIEYNCENLLEVLSSNYSLSPRLKNYISNNFKTEEQLNKIKEYNIAIKNIEMTKWIGISSIVLGLGSIVLSSIGFYIDYDIAKNISSTITFQDDEQFKKIISSKEVIIKNENNIVFSENFYKTKTELSLDIFKEQKGVAN